MSGIEEAPGVGEFEEELDPKSLLWRVDLPPRHPDKKWRPRQHNTVYDYHHLPFWIIHMSFVVAAWNMLRLFIQFFFSIFILLYQPSRIQTFANFFCNTKSSPFPSRSSICHSNFAMIVVWGIGFDVRGINCSSRVIVGCISLARYILTKRYHNLDHNFWKKVKEKHGGREFAKASGGCIMNYNGITIIQRSWIRMNLVACRLSFTTSRDLTFPRQRRITPRRRVFFDISFSQDLKDVRVSLPLTLDTSVICTWTRNNDRAS